MLVFSIDFLQVNKSLQELNLRGNEISDAGAIALAEAGANLIIISRTKKDLDEVSKVIKKLKMF